jgi:hypothetical protein
MPRLQWWRGRRRRDGWRSTGCALLTAGAAGGRPELARRRFSKRMSSRWSPGQPSVFRSRWESRRPSPRAGSNSLVRLVGRRGLQLCAGRIRGSNVASSWGTPRRSAGIQARAPTGSHDRPVRADRSNNKSTSATAHAMAADAQPLLRLWSTTDAALRTCVSASLLSCRPVFDLGTQPELHATRA